MEDHVNRWYVTKNTHIEEDHVDGQHVIWNLNTEDHVDRWCVIGIITVKNHGDGHHVTDIIAEQWQPENLRSIEELNQNNRLDHGIIDIEELLND